MATSSDLRRLAPVAALSLMLCSVGMAYAMSPADCAAEADRAAREQGTVMGGAASGAVGGAVFGAIVGNKKSARRGAALGAVVGGSRNAVNKDYVYRRVYDDCMRGARYGY